MLEGPFFLCLKKFDKKKNKTENEIFLFLTKEEKNKNLGDVLSGFNTENDSLNKQLIIEIYWNEKYNDKLLDILRPQKIDKFLEQDLEQKDKKQNLNYLNESIDSTTKSSKGSNNEEIKLQYKQQLRKNIISNTIKLNIKSTEQNDNNMEIENQKDENEAQAPSPQQPEPNSSSTQAQEPPKMEMSLDDAFEILREEELLDENNEWYCENCKKKQRPKKKLEIYNAPKILIIQIKRFSHITKINTKVNFPLIDLDLSKYIISDDESKNAKYDLFAVANHYGSLSFGHYTAVCKNSLNDKWYEYNDSSVCEITDISKIVTQSAYVLFYRQKGLSRLNWNEIYKKSFIDIDINNPKTLVDYNYDFIEHINKFKKIENDNNDINEFDKKIIEIMNKIEIQKKIDDEKKNKLIKEFLNRKRKPSDKE